MIMNDPLIQVPLDNVLQIFSYLSAQDLGRCCQVIPFRKNKCTFGFEKSARFSARK